jgi:hypothetical protein
LGEVMIGELGEEAADILHKGTFSGEEMIHI